jgi:hypothetical protein
MIHVFSRRRLVAFFAGGTGIAALHLFTAGGSAAAPADVATSARFDFAGTASAGVPANLTAVSLASNRPATFRMVESGGRRVLSDDSATGGDVLYDRAGEPLSTIDESYSFVYSGQDSVVEPFFVDARPKNRDVLEGFATNLSASQPGDESAGTISHRYLDDEGQVQTAALGRLRTVPYFYKVGHTYRVDAIADSSSGLLTTRVYDVALGPQAFDLHIKKLHKGVRAYAGIVAPRGRVAIVDFSFGPHGDTPVRPHVARRAEDYLNYLGYNAAVSGPVTSSLSLAFQQYFPQLLIRHVRVPAVTRYLPSINAVARFGIDANVLTGSTTTVDGLRAYIDRLALKPDSIELWNEPNYSFSGGQHEAEFATKLPLFAAAVARSYPGMNIWGPSVLPDQHGLPSDAAKLAPLASFITAWNAHSYTMGTPENLGYGRFFSNACGPSKTEDCGYYGAPNYNDNLSAVIAPDLPGVTTEGAGSYGSYPDICGHSNVDLPTQQAYVERGMLYNFKLGHLRIYPYKFLDDGGCSDGFGTYGIMSRLVGADGRISIVPKPAYVSLVYLDHLIDDGGASAKSFEPQPLEYRLGGGHPDVESLLLAESDGTYRLILWSDASLWNYDANGPHAPGSGLPLLSEHVHVGFERPMYATVFSQAPGTGIWSAGERTRSKAIDVTVNQYPLVVAIAPEGAEDRKITLPQEVPTAGPLETPGPKRPAQPASSSP